MARAVVLHVTPTWASLWQVVVDYVKGGGFLPQAQPFQGRDYDGDWKLFRRVCKALEIHDYTMKDDRHAWIVQALKDKIGLHPVGSQGPDDDLRSTASTSAAGMHTAQKPEPPPRAPVNLAGARTTGF